MRPIRIRKHAAHFLFGTRDNFEFSLVIPFIMSQYRPCLFKVNGRPLELVEPRALQYKLQEPILLLGKDRFADIDIRIRVKGGGHTSQIYAIRQALSKVILCFFLLRQRL